MEEKIANGYAYCRKCAKILPEKVFYDCVDMGFIDANMKLSVCKNCANSIYDELFSKYQSMEKALHKMCTSLNIMFSNEAVSATKAHIETLLASGKMVSAVFGIYKQKLLATQKTMDKNTLADMTYTDVGTIYTDKQIDLKEIPIPQEVQDFWGRGLKRDQIEFLEMQYANFKQTHKADSYAEIVLLKEVCYTLLHIKELRASNDDTQKAVQELQSLMKNLAISPNAINASGTNKGIDAFGLWIQDIESKEPAQWLKTDPRGDMYRDVANVEDYFQKFIVRPLKNFITNSKDFNIDDEPIDEDELKLDHDDTNFRLIDDGEVED